MPFNSTRYNGARYNGLGIIRVVMAATLTFASRLPGLTKLTRLVKAAFTGAMALRSKAEGGHAEEVTTSGGKRFKL